MAWSHFTDYLDAGELLTQAQYNELLDAVEERFKAVHSDMAWGSEISAMKTGHLWAVRVPWRGSTGEALESGVVTWSLHAILEVLGSYHYAPETAAPPATGYGSEVTRLAADDLGISSADWTTIKTAALAGLNQRLYWNVLRRAVQRLVIAVPMTYDVTYHTKVGDVEIEDEAGKFASMQAAGESSSAGFEFRTYYDSFDAEGLRTSGKVKIALPASTTYTLWAYTDLLADHADPGRWKWGAGNYAANSEFFIELATGLSATGEIAVGLDWAAYYSGAPAVPDVTSDPFPFFISPTFTHPIEAL